MSVVLLWFQTRQLIQVCDQKMVDLGVSRYEESKQELQANKPPNKDGHLTAPTNSSKDPSPERTWRWSGTDFIKSPTEEPWVSQNHLS